MRQRVTGPRADGDHCAEDLRAAQLKQRGDLLQRQLTGLGFVLLALLALLAILLRIGGAI